MVEPLPFTSKAAGLILSSVSQSDKNVTGVQSSSENSTSERCAENRGFSPGTMVFSYRES